MQIVTHALVGNHPGATPPRRRQQRIPLTIQNDGRVINRRGDDGKRELKTDENHICGEISRKIGEAAKSF